MFIVHHTNKESLHVSGAYTLVSLDSLADQLTDVYLRVHQVGVPTLHELTLNFQALDSRAKRLVFSFLKGLALRQQAKQVNDLVVNWHYDHHDLDMAEFGEILEELLPLHFQFRELGRHVA
jgi:hypothetical protein